MNAYTGFNGTGTGTGTGTDRWTSLSIGETTSGYTVCEDAGRFRLETATETTMRLIGIILIVAAYAQLLIPGHLFPGSALVTKSLLLVSYSGVGFGLYAFASRGFRKELKIDLTRREFRVAKLNMHGRSRLARHIPLEQVESIFVRRSGDRSAPAALILRTRGIPREVCVLRGAQAEVEALHQRLCRDIRVVPAKTVSPARARVRRAPGRGVAAAAM